MNGFGCGGPTSAVPGPQGPGFNPRGSYDPTRAYAMRDLVSFGTGSYVAVTAVSPGVIPGTAPLQWSLVVGALPMVGATEQSAGAAGVVPLPPAGTQNRVLKGDGTWGASGEATTFATFADAAAATFGAPCIVQVVADETNDGDPTTYMWTGASLEWVVTA